MGTILVVLLFGLFWSYVIFLLPALIVAVLRRSWAYVAAGFVTFGLAWYLGSLEPAKPESWWDRRFGGGEQAFGTRQRKLSRRRRAVTRTGMAAATILLVGLTTTFPTAIVGTDRTSLQYSVGRPDLVRPPLQHGQEREMGVLPVRQLGQRGHPVPDEGRPARLLDGLSGAPLRRYS